MPAKITLRDARLERMRGNHKEALEGVKPNHEPQEDQPEVTAAPSQTVVTVDTAPIAHAMGQQAHMLVAAMEAMRPEQKAAAKWNFRITERDRMGNIVSFTAEAE